MDGPAPKIRSRDTGIRDARIDMVEIVQDVCGTAFSDDVFVVPKLGVLVSSDPVTCGRVADGRVTGERLFTRLFQPPHPFLIV